jgi:prevent-host-death family protein
MTRVGVRELRQHASRYLEEVKAGRTVEVTERGELVALLVPPKASSGARDHLVALGRLIPSKGPLLLPVRLVLPESEMSASATLAELRDERAP